jgi:protein TonB
MKRFSLIVIIILLFGEFNYSQVEFKETIAQYEGGESALMSYLTNNLKYPDAAKEQCLTGTVVVLFVIDSLGYMDSIRLYNSIHPLLDSAAIRVVRSINKKWIPTIQNGKPVSTSMRLPIKFVLFNAGCFDNNYYYNQGVKYYEKGYYDEALESYNEAIRLNPEDVDALYNCVMIKIKQNDIPSACNYIRKIKEINKPDADALFEKYCK